MAGLPPVDRAAIERVLDAFDADVPSQQWRGFDWQRPGRQRSAVRYNGRLYPLVEVVRRVVRQQTGDWPARVPPRDTAINYICHPGFTVVMAPFIEPYSGPPRPRPRYTVVLEPSEEGWFAHAPALQGCHAWGETQEEALNELAIVYNMIMGEFDDRRVDPPADVAVAALAAAS